LIIEGEDEAGTNLCGHRGGRTSPSIEAMRSLFQWAVNFESIELILHSELFPNVFSLQMAPNTVPVAGIRSRPVHNKYVFQFLSSQDQHYAIHELRRAYWMWTENHLTNSEIRPSKKSKGSKNVTKHFGGE
jgi:hypothetical protein